MDPGTLKAAALRCLRGSVLLSPPRSQGDDDGDGGGTTVAYYQSEFEVHVSQEASLDQAVESLEQLVGGQQGRMQPRPEDGLSVNSVVSQGLIPPPPPPD